MGADLLLATIPLDASKAPDWDAAQAAIDALTVEAYERDLHPDGVVSDERIGWDELLGGEYYDDLSDPEQREALAEQLEGVRGRLATDLKELRDVLAPCGYLRDLVTIHVRGVKLVVAGGMSWGDEPCEGFGQINRLWASGALEACGALADCGTEAESGEGVRWIRTRDLPGNAG